MSDQVDLLFRYRIRKGHEAQFEEYLTKVLPLTEEEEPYIFEYELFRNDDGSILQHERYENEEAIYKHLELTAEGQAAWNEAVELLDQHIIGDLSEAFWQRFGAPGVQRYTRFRAVSR